MTGRIYQVETFGTHDGPGIRYVLFLQGCRMGCRFCHNPGTWPREGKSKVQTVDEVLADVTPYLPIYQGSGGGITVSGGEPLLQAPFVAALFRRCRELGIHTVLDTSGDGAWEELKQVLAVTDAVQYSIKSFVPARHRQLTCGELAPLLDNLRRTADLVPLTLRYVLVPGWTDGPEDLEALATFWHSLPRPCPVELLPYHTLGRQQWREMGQEDPLQGVPACEPAIVERVKTFLAGRGVAMA